MTVEEKAVSPLFSFTMARERTAGRRCSGIQQLEGKGSFHGI